jgi:excisionase family DNA binding protein
VGPAAAKGALPASGGGDEMLTRSELAAKLRVHLRTIENWQRDGYLPFIKIGNTVWFHWPDVLQHFKTHFRTLRCEPEAAPLATMHSTSPSGRAGNLPVGTPCGGKPLQIPNSSVNTNKKIQK